MYENFTLDYSDDCNVMEKEAADKCLYPRQETLALIMQFARACYVEKELPGQLSTIILN
jgi:hypothetical protein